MSGHEYGDGEGEDRKSFWAGGAKAVECFSGNPMNDEMICSTPGLWRMKGEGVALAGLL